MAGLVVRPGARILRGHDWVYSSEVLKVFGSPEPGAVISLKDGRDRLLGVGIYNPASQIVARRISRRREELGHDFFRRRLARAVAWRERNGCRMDFCRLVWSEADGLPGVVADRIGSMVVLQTNTLAMDLRRAELAAALMDLPGVRGVFERNDSPARAAEKLPSRTGLLAGEDPGPILVEAAGVRWEVRPLDGQKTGIYLDQAENWRLVAAHARGCRVLDVFSHHGGFALACAAAGAAEVTAIESGEAAVERLAYHVRLNALAVEILREDAFDALRRLKGRQFDLVILDPPSFTHARGRAAGARRGYRELHRLAAPLLAREGVLATFCCSHHVQAREFEEAVMEGLWDGQRTARVLARMGQPPDHPVALHIPESEYLKGLLLAMTPAF